MNIVVLVKQVPDSGSERKLDPSDNTVARAGADNVINEMDEYAIEEALTVRDAQGGEVTILTVGPDSATDAIRKALSMGADKAVHVVDEAIHGSCAVATSAVIAAPHSTRSYSSCCRAAAITALVWMAHEPWMASSTTCTALSAPIDSALRTVSFAASGPMQRMVTSPPCASLIFNASSMAYSSISLMTLFAEARSTA